MNQQGVIEERYIITIVRYPNGASFIKGGKKIGQDARKPKQVTQPTQMDICQDVAEEQSLFGD